MATSTIIVDSRESRSGILPLLQASPDIAVEVRELSCGDYMVRDDFPIERKTATDFVLSIMDRRLFEQVAKMKGEFGKCVVIIEGDVYKTRSGIDPKAITGALSWLVGIEGGSVLPSSGVANTVEHLTMLARHLQQGLGYTVGLRSSKPKDPQALSSFVIEGLPGVGGATSRVLLAHFGSAHKVLSADVASLQKVPGIGPKTAQNIRAVLDAEYVK